MIPHLPEAISRARRGPVAGIRSLSTSMMAVLFLSAAEDRITVTDDISVSCMLVSVVAMMAGGGSEAKGQVTQTPARGQRSEVGLC